MDSISSITIILNKMSNDPSTPVVDANEPVHAACDVCHCDPCVCPPEACVDEPAAEVSEPAVVTSEPIAANAVLPLMDTEPTLEDSIAQLAKLAKVPYTENKLEESTLIEVRSLKAPVMDALHRLGRIMLDKSEKVDAGALKGSKERGSRLKTLNNMTRIGELLVNLGEPFAKPLEQFPIEDIEFIASKFNVPVEKFMRVAGLNEAVVKMRPYQEENDMEPMSKKQAMGDQPLVNNTGDNSMPDPENDTKKLKVKTVKESTTMFDHKKFIEELQKLNEDKEDYINRIVGEAYDDFDVQDFVNEVGSDFNWEGRKDEGISPEDLEFSSEYIMKSLCGYLEHWLELHFSEHVDIELKEVAGLFNRKVKPFLEQHGYKITPGLKVVHSEDAAGGNDPMAFRVSPAGIPTNEAKEEDKAEKECPECHEDPCVCDDEEMKESKKSKKEDCEAGVNAPLADEEKSLQHVDGKNPDKESVANFEVMAGLKESFTYGDKVEIVDDKHHKGDMGEVVSFDKDANTVVVDLAMHGKHSFPAAHVKSMIDEAPVETKPDGPHDHLEHIAHNIESLDDDGYQAAAMELFGHPDEHRNATPADIEDAIMSMSSDHLKTFCDMLGFHWNENTPAINTAPKGWDKVEAGHETVGPYDIGGEMDPGDPHENLNEPEVDEGNAHDDLRAKKSDHDTLMNKNIEDAKHEYILDETEFGSDAHARKLTDEIKKLDDKAFMDIMRLLFTGKEVHMPHDDNDIAMELKNVDHGKLEDIENYLSHYHSEMNKVATESEECDDESEEELNEKAPPGMEKWVKANKKKFKKEYGADKGEEVLYATAWKRHNESVEQIEKALTEEYNSFNDTVSEDVKKN
jgi:hypothetical protein